jgi:hypothetical protein
MATGSGAWKDSPRLSMAARIQPFFTTERHGTFFTTEHTEEERRATEYCRYWG